MDDLARLLRLVLRLLGTDVDHLVPLARASLAQAAAGGLDRLLLLAWQARPHVGTRRRARAGAS